MTYSLDRASIGSSFAAFLAGIYPNTTPTRVENRTAITIEKLENIIEKTILKGIVKKLDVKAIYKECKKACIDSLVDIDQKLIS